MQFVSALFKSMTSPIAKRPLEEEAPWPPSKRVKIANIWSVVQEVAVEDDTELGYITVYQSNDEIKTMEQYVEIGITHLFQAVYEVGKVPSGFTKFEQEWRDGALAEAVQYVHDLLKMDSPGNMFHLVATRCHMF